MTPAENPLYLDYNATTPLAPEVLEAMLPYLREHFGNPSSGHPYGRRARAAVEQARAQVAALVGARPEEIVFTSGGTEANNLAIRGAAAASRRTGILTTTIEHPATAAPCALLERQGWMVTRAGVDETGRVRPEGVAAALGEFAPEECALLTVIHANNETGVLQPVAQLAALARARGVLVHADAAQSVGKVPVAVDALGVDLLSIAGHKLYAPKGVGALYVRRGTPLDPLLLGAGQERGVRPGTESVASVVALGAACELARATLSEEGRRLRGLRERLWTRLQANVPGLALNGHPTERLPNTLSVRFPGVRGSAVLVHAPEVAASTGSACHAGEESAPAVITAMGVDPSAALGTVRLSLGRGSTEAQVDAAAETLGRAWRRVSAEVGG